MNNPQLHNLKALNGLLIAHLNICSIRNKVDEVKRILYEGDIDILGISESNLDENYLDNMLQIDGYCVTRLDRQDHSIRLSGGVSLLHKEYTCLQ